MRAIRTSFALLLGTFLFASWAYAQDQDSPSLGDAARQARLQKQQKDAQAKDGKPATAPASSVQNADGQNAATTGKDAESKDTDGKTTAKTPHVITNDEIPEHVSTGQPSGVRTPVSYSTPASVGSEGAAAQWKQSIQSQRSAIASLQSQIDSLNDSIKFAPANCVSGCVQWNERQRQKQDQVESMKLQLQDMQKHLEDMQEACRQQGFGSSVYDP